MTAGAEGSPRRRQRGSQSNHQEGSESTDARERAARATDEPSRQRDAEGRVSPGEPGPSSDTTKDAAGSSLAQGTPDWAALGRLVAAALPVLVILLPAAGYTVRVIGFMGKPWLPFEVALYASVSARP